MSKPPYVSLRDPCVDSYPDVFTQAAARLHILWLNRRRDNALQLAGGAIANTIGHVSEPETAQLLCDKPNRPL